MDTHFRLSFFRILFLFFAFTAVFSAKAQNSLVVQVLPPYSNRPADYANTPNKLVVIVTINGRTTQNYSGKVFFRGKLKNVSGDIEISSRPGFKPSMPVNVPVGPGGIPVPYTLTFSEIQNLFDWNNLNFKGVSVDRIVQYGMPEDLYQFCIQTIDYVTGAVLIEETCSPPFNVALLEPPMVIQPLNETTLANMEPQSVLFNWTLSPGAPITTRYTLRIVELMEGVNPNDAVRSNNYPRKLLETTVTGNSFLYTNAAPKLEPGKKYAFAVIASSDLRQTQSVFRNNGMSEIHTFQMEKPPAATPVNRSLKFLYPNSTDKNIEVNSETSSQLMWWWFNPLLTLAKDTSANMVKFAIENAGVKSYQLNIENVSGQPPVAFSQKFTVEAPTPMLSHQYLITKERAAEIGLKNGNSYKATVRALDKNETVINTIEVDFLFKLLPEENHTPVKVHGALNYLFKGHPGMYNAINTPVTIEAYLAPNDRRATSQSTLKSLIPTTTSETAIATMTVMTDDKGVFDADFKLPGVSEGDSVFFRVKSDNQYYLDRNFKEAGARIAGNSTYVNFGQLTAQTYGYSLKLYVKKLYTHTDELNSKSNTETLTAFPEGVELILYRKNKKDYMPPVEGNVTDYSHLKGYVEVARAKTQLETVGGKKAAFVQFDRLLALPAPAGNSSSGGVLGRTSASSSHNFSKAAQSTSGTSAMTQSASGIYTMTQSSGTSTTTTQSSKKSMTTQETSYTTTQSSGASHTGLIQTTINGEEYYIKAVNPASQTSQNFTLQNSMLQMNNYTDNGFIAEEMTYSLSAPAAFHEDSLYRKVTATYNIASTAPPTSKVKGNLTYKWYSDPTGAKRPMANTKFHVVVDYLQDGELLYNIGEYSLTNIDEHNYSFHYEDGSGIYLYDKGKIAGSGKTDANGNFEITISNHNMKGDLMKGTLLTNFSGDPLSMPEWQQEAGNFGTASNAGSIGNIANVLSQMSTLLTQGGFTLPPATNGYNASNTATLKRIFRIVPENPYYYPSMDNFTVQPFETTEIPVTQCSYVKEMSVKVTAYEYKAPSALRDGSIIPGENKGKKLDTEIKKLIFRDPSKSKPDMPLGEGDGHYVRQKLMNPQYGTYTQEEIKYTNDAYATGASFFTKEFDYICSPVDKATVTFTGLLATCEDYYIEACSDPAGGTLHYGASFKSLGKYKLAGGKMDTGSWGALTEWDNDPDRWLGKKEPPVIEENILLKPLESRIFVRVEDNITHKPLSDAKIGFLQKNLCSSSANNHLTDKDGYAQIRASQSPIKDWIQCFKNNGWDADKTNIEFLLSANAGGYKLYLTSNTGSISPKGTQWSHTANMTPAGKLSVYVYSDEKNTPLTSDPATSGTTKALAGNTTAMTTTTATTTTTAANKSATTAATTTTTTNAANKNMTTTGSLTPTNLTASQFEQAASALKFVEAYIQVDTATVVETKNGKLTDHPVPAKKGTKIRIIPKDLAYFEEEFIIETEGNGDYNFTVPLLRKKHRIEFIVMDEVLKGAIPNATVTLGDIVKKTGSNGKVEFEFENVSVNNHTFVFRGPSGSGYIPVVHNLINEESKSTQQYNVYLSAGSTVSGVVNLDGKAVKGAKVYLDISQSATSSGSSSFYAANEQYTTSTGTTGSYSSALSGTKISGTTGSGTTASAADTTLETSKSTDLIVAYTNSQGQYSLNGIPVNNDKIDVIATLDNASFTVVGDRKQANIKNKTATVNLNLKSYEGMYINNLYGFPLTVEKLEPQGTSVKVTGLVEWSAGLNDFEMRESYRQLRVEDVLFTAQQGSKNGVANGASVLLKGVTGLKLGYLDGKYNVLLSASTVMNSAKQIVPVELLIERTSDGNGGIKGKVQIVDNSFNYTESYLNFTGKDNFYLATIEGGKVNNYIRPVVSPLSENDWSEENIKNVQNSGGKREFTSASGNSYTMTVDAAGSVKIDKKALTKTPPRYHLSNSNGGSIAFKLLEFNATANPANSYIDQEGKIHLNVELSCKIPHAQPENFTVNIADIVLDNNKVYPASGSKLNLKLGKSWTLEVKDWEMSVKEGGIYSTNALIRTSALDIPIGKFVLRHDMFAMLKPQMTSLKLGGGITSVQVDTLKANAILQWDNKVGSDMAGHWRLSITSKTAGQPAAVTGTLDGLFSAGKLTPLKIEYIELLDNDEGRVQLGANPTLQIHDNKLANFNLQSIYNGADYLNLAGTLNIGAPNVGNMMLTLKYTKEGGKQKLEPQNIKLDFVPKAQVHFIAKDVPKNISLSKEEIRIEGSVQEQPQTFNPMPAKLIASANLTNPKRYKIEIPQGWVSQLSAKTTNTDAATTSSQGYRLKIKEGGANVDNGNQWTKLTYSGYMYDNKNTKNGISVENPPEITFTVLGDIMAESKKGLSISGTSTPFGNFSTMYDFDKKRLIGSLDAKGVTLGAVQIIEGQAEFLCDPNGFYMAGGFKTYVTVPIIQGNYNLGMMLGYYPNNGLMKERIWPLVTKYKNPLIQSECYVEHINYNLSGFYFTLDRVLFDVNVGYNLLITGAHIKAYSSIGAELFADFGDKVTLGVSARARLQAEFGVKVALGLVEATGGINGYAGIDFGMYTGKPTLDFELKMDFSAKAQVYVPLIGWETILPTTTVNCYALIGTSGHKFNIGSGGANFQACPPAYTKPK